jgi:hypothetical protein
MTLETPTLTPVKRKPGAPRGNTNALKHGFRSALQPQAAIILAASVKPHAGRMLFLDPLQFTRSNLRLLDSIDQVLITLAPRLLSAKTFKERRVFFTPIVKLIHAKLKVIKLICLWDNPLQVLRDLAHQNPFFVQWEFNERGLREYPIIPPPCFDKFCSEPFLTPNQFRNNTVLPQPGAGLIVCNFFLKSTRFSRAPSKNPVPSPFLTDQQWLLISGSLSSLLDELDSSRRYKRNKLGFPARLLMEAVLIKHAYGIPWKELSRCIRALHRNLGSFPLRKCQIFYRELYNSGFLRSVYKQLHWHFLEYGGTSLEELVSQHHFVIGKRFIFLDHAQPLTWQNFTALLLLQRAYHNFRARQRESRNFR